MGIYYKGYKIRIYPTKAQEQQIWQFIGAQRFVWNYMLNLQNERYKNHESFLSSYDMCGLLPALKKQEEYKWLADAPSNSLQYACTKLYDSYRLYFQRKQNKPKFKSKKKSKQSYRVSNNYFYFTESYIQIPKLGRVKYKTDFDIPYGNQVRFCKISIKRQGDKWMVFFNLEHENQVQDLNDFQIGIDLGVKEQAVVAYDDQHLVFHNINKSQKVRSLKKQIAHVQKSISRKYKASKSRTGEYAVTRNIEKETAKIRKLYSRLTNIHNNYIHQVTHSLVSLLPQRVIMEDLNIQGMIKNRHLSRAVHEQCFNEFARQMQYKCEWNGIEFVKADRFYPSSKTCSCCGSVKQSLRLSDRMYICEDCGLKIDRDYNAAINLMRYKAY